MTKNRSDAEDSGRKSIFASVWPDREIVQQPAAQLPWGQNVVLMDKIADSHDRIWYAEKTRQEVWEWGDGE